MPEYECERWAIFHTESHTAQLPRKVSPLQEPVIREDSMVDREARDLDRKSFTQATNYESLPAALHLNPRIVDAKKHKE